MYACTIFGLFVFFPGVFLSSRVTGACPVTTDLIMRVNVITTSLLHDILDLSFFRLVHTSLSMRMNLFFGLRSLVL